MSDLTEFLLARVAEDEAVARAAAAASLAAWEIVPDGRFPWHTGLLIAVVSSTWDACIDPEVAEHTARHDPARVLAECDAKRRTVESCLAGLKYDVACGEGHWGNFESILELLALPYADHADYDEAWRP